MSEPGPPTQRRGGSPGPARAAAPRPGAAPDRRASKHCRRCGRTAPLSDFLLLHDPVAEDRRWATRHWCSDCLLEQGHVTQRQYDASVRVTTLLSAQQRAEVEAKIREHQLVTVLIDRALDDPVYARALQRAANGARIAGGMTAPDSDQDGGHTQKACA